MTAGSGTGKEALMSSRFAPLLAVTLFPVIAAFAQPVITSQYGIVNSATYRTPGLPGSGIAQGSIFSIFGTGLGRRHLGAANAFPLPITVNGTSVNITMGTTQTSAIVLGANSGQINAILPSTTPTGMGTITATYNGQTNASQPIQLVDSAFGI
jgi:uncharacterized protein (TIGR03437 family)